MQNLILDYSFSNLYDENESSLKELEICPYCKIKCKNVHSNGKVSSWDEPRYRILKATQHEGFKIYACVCGWWVAIHTAHLVEEYPEYGDVNNYVKTSEAVLKKFGPVDINAPLEELIKFAAKKPEIMRDINPTKMELLVGDTLGRALDCKVKHCGRTGDGGIDLYIFDGETPLLVQVKKREKPSTESVITVREMLGSTLLKGSSRALIVTTAKKFSKQAINSARAAVNLGLLKEFRLVDFDSFSQILNIVNKDIKLPWQKYALKSMKLSSYWNSIDN